MSIDFATTMYCIIPVMRGHKSSLCELPNQEKLKNQVAMVNKIPCRIYVIEDVCVQKSNVMIECSMAHAGGNFVMRSGQQRGSRWAAHHFLF